MDTAPAGVIFFSMGSNVRGNQMSGEHVAAILRVFGRLKQRIVWKWEDGPMAGQPANVLLLPWVPQADVLAHPNMRLFITHGGRGGLNEARYHGVPVLGMPVFGDQPNNIMETVAEGWGLPLDYHALTEASFEHGLLEVLNNGSYRQVVQKSAALFRDRPLHPLDTAIYWVEYVLRHDGAKHMQSQAVHLNWAQYMGLDVAAFFAAVAWVSWKLSVWFWVAVWQFAGRRWTERGGGAGAGAAKKVL